jgi:hypothetical protein
MNSAIGTSPLPLSTCDERATLMATWISGIIAPSACATRSPAPCRTSRRVLSLLVRSLGDFDLAEDALQDAVAAALERWPVDGVASNPSGWLVTTARRRPPAR